MSTRFRLPLSAFAFALLLSACGNKGPLVLPDKPDGETAVPATPADQPAPAGQATPEATKSGGDALPLDDEQ